LLQTQAGEEWHNTNSADDVSRQPGRRPSVGDAASYEWWRIRCYWSIVYCSLERMQAAAIRVLSATGNAIDQNSVRF